MTEDRIYPPSEDSFFLLKFLEENIKRNIESSVDLGSGSGILSLFLANVSDRVLAIDVEFIACRYTWSSIRKNKLDWKVDIICCDCLSAIRSNKTFDLIVSNPPYLPCETESILWCAGSKGIEIPLKFIIESIHHLTKEGVMYIVLCSLGNLRKIEKTLLKNRVFYRNIAQRNVGLFEKLCIYEIRKSDNLVKNKL